jgi:acyl-CoA synthetase (AMP-forming)/AMP-acid ligase II
MPEDFLSLYASSQPGKPAVIDDRPDGTVTVWTYAELEAQSNRVANLLLRLGAGPGTKILWCCGADRTRRRSWRSWVPRGRSARSPCR